jgi:hypothetical protein
MVPMAWGICANLPGLGDLGSAVLRMAVVVLLLLGSMAPMLELGISSQKKLKPAALKMSLLLWTQ